MEKNPLVKVSKVQKTFRTKHGILNALKDVDLEIPKGQTMGLVGESGCGKSTLGRVILNLHNATSGKVFFDSKEVTQLKGRDLKQFRKRAQIIFQDPFASLNPRWTIGEVLTEPLRYHRPELKGPERTRECQRLLDLVGLHRETIDRFPHEFSGGQRQRICIARALATMPEFIVCDEPVSALDVSIQAQILNLLKQLQRDLGLTYLFISHDLRVIEHLCSQVAVMYLGKIIEIGPRESFFARPVHPYSRALLSAIPEVNPQGKGPRILLRGDVPSPFFVSPGCSFQSRCFEVRSECSVNAQTLNPVLQNPSETAHHFAACEWVVKKGS